MKEACVIISDLVRYPYNTVLSLGQHSLSSLLKRLIPDKLDVDSTFNRQWWALFLVNSGL